MIFVYSLILGIIIYSFLIPFLRKKKLGQAIRAEGPEAHLTKKGTPTMGGLGFIISSFILFLGFAVYYSYDYRIVILLLGSLLMFGLVGFCDDFLIIKRGKNDGLNAKTKIILELIIGVMFYYLYQYFGFSTKLFIELGILYLPFVVLMLISSSNAFNLTDGLDGLLGGLSIICFSALGYIAYLNENEVAFVFILSLLGGLFSFLIFNYNPAKIFMGDTGSLALGGIAGVLAILLKVELIFVIMALPFILETLSVIIQVLYYKKTKKRFFKMAPLHHHFELMGYSEKAVVFIFWMFGLIMALIGLIIYGGIR